MKRGDTVIFDTKNFPFVKEKTLEGEIQVIDYYKGKAYQLDIKVGDAVHKHVSINSIISI